MIIRTQNSYVVITKKNFHLRKSCSIMGGSLNSLPLKYGKAKQSYETIKLQPI